MSKFHVIPDAGDGQPAVIEITGDEQLALASAEAKIDQARIRELEADRDHLLAGLEQLARVWKYGNGAGPHAQKVLDARPGSRGATDEICNDGETTP